MTTFQKNIFKLIKSALYGVVVQIDDDFDWELAKQYGKGHKIIPLLFYGAYNSKINIPEKIKSEFGLITSGHLFISINQTHEFDSIKKAFLDNNVDFLPLKGAIQKKLYPKPEMRPMGDIDILIKVEQYNKIKEIMKDFGYVEDKESDHELVWIKQKIMVELHKRVIPSYNEDYYKYFGDGWKLAKQSQNLSSEFYFTPEDNFIYLFTHFSKHYRDAGIGIMHLVDLYVYIKNNQNMNYEYIETELKKLKLYEFYRNIIRVAGVCFEEEAASDITDLIINKVFQSGSYGTKEAQAISITVKKTKHIKNKNNIRLVLFLKRVFMPYKEMCRRHKVLEKYSFLLPFFWLYRVFQVLFLKHDSIKKELENVKYSEKNSVLKYYEELSAVGLDFDFKE